VTIFQEDLRGFGFGYEEIHNLAAPMLYMFMALRYESISETEFGRSEMQRRRANASQE
jgi:hypothetical protein